MTKNEKKSAVVLGLSLVVLICFGLTAKDQEVEGRNERSTRAADTLIARNIRARGGYKALQKIKTLTKTGLYKEGSAIVEVREDNKRPNLKRASWKYGDQGGAEGSDGVNPPWEFDGKTVKINTGEAALTTLRGAEFDDPFIDYREKGHRVEFVANEKMGGLDVIHLRVTLKDGFIRHYYFDSKTSLAVALRQSMPFHAKGPAVESYTYYDDYRPVAGVLFPFQITQKRASDESVMFEIQWKKVEANLPLDQSWFSKPRV